MSKCSYGELQYEDYADIRLHLVLRKVGQGLFYQLLKVALPKEERESYYERLEAMNVSMKKFDISQRHKLRRDTTGASFDITLIYKILLSDLPKIASPSSNDWTDPEKLEFHLKKVKEIRNELMHSGVLLTSVELKLKFDLLCEVFMEISDRTCDRFDLSEKIKKSRRKQIKTDTEYVYSSQLTGVDLDDYLINHGIEEAKSRYRKISCVNPVDFFVGINFNSKINDVFVTLEIKELDENEGKGKRISFYHMLKAFYEEDHSVIIVEGVAGSGKTTLIKYFLSTWINEDPSVEYLKDFDFVIYFQCNNTYIKSINDLMRSVMPETSRAFKGEDLIDSLFCRKLLFIVDGIDESNSGTRSALMELFHKAHGTNVKFFCTSRPEKIQWLHRITGELSCCTYSIVGISEKNRKSYVEKLYNCYKNILQNSVICSLTDVLTILDNFPPTINSELKLPLFLSLFTYLCTVEPEKVKALKSVASLYMQLISALKDKLYTRALTKNSVLYSDKEDEEIKQDIDSCYSVFCQHSFISLSEHDGALTKGSIKIIKEKSASLGLNANEVLSAFLVVKVVLTPKGITENVSFPHKGLQEFLAASHVSERIIKGENLDAILNIQKQSKEKVESPSADLPVHSKMPSLSKLKLLDLNTDFMRFQNFILQLAGILGILDELNDDRVNEIIRMYKKTGTYRFKQWLRLLTNLKYHNLACEHILTQFKKMIVDDSNLETILAMLRYNCPQELILTINNERTDPKKIRKVLLKLTEYQCNVKLIMKYQLLKPSLPNDLDCLKILTQSNSRCVLSWFQGCLTVNEMEMLPSSVQCLFVGVGTRNQCQALKKLPEKTGLNFLRLHIEKNSNTVDIQPLESLPKLVNYYLYISGLDSQYKDIKWAIRVALAVNPTKIYGKLLLAKSNLNEKMTLKLLTLLKQNGIQIQDKTRRGVCIASPCIDQVALSSISSHCYKMLGCKLWLLNDEEIFDF